MRKQKNRELPITVSMGFSYGDGNHGQIGRVALSNLNLAAEVRGGDQAVVKRKKKVKDPYFLLEVGQLLLSSALVRELVL